MGKRATADVSHDALLASVRRYLATGDPQEHAPLLLAVLRVGDSVVCGAARLTVTGFEYTQWRRTGVVYTDVGPREWTDLRLAADWNHVFYQPAAWTDVQCTHLGMQYALELGKPKTNPKTSGRMLEFALFKLPPMRSLLLPDPRTREVYDLGSYARGSHGRSMCDPFCRKEGGRFYTVTDSGQVHVSSIGQVRFWACAARVDGWIRTNADWLRRVMKSGCASTTSAVYAHKSQFHLDAEPIIGAYTSSAAPGLLPAEAAPVAGHAP